MFNIVEILLMFGPPTAALIIGYKVWTNPDLRNKPLILLSVFTASAATVGGVMLGIGNGKPSYLSSCMASLVISCLFAIVTPILAQMEEK